MPTRKNFKGQFEDEYVICFFRKHWVKLLPRMFTILGTLFLMGLMLRYTFLLANQDGFVRTLAVGGHVFLVYALHSQFLSLFHYFLQTVMVTNYRIVDVDRSIFFRDSKDSIDLMNVQDVKKIQNGLFENLLNYGTLRIVLSGTHASVNIDLVPRPDYQFKKMNAVKAEKPSPSQALRNNAEWRAVNNPVKVVQAARDELTHMESQLNSSYYR